VIGAPMKELGRQLRTPLSSGIVALELARSPLHARLIVRAWGPQGSQAAVKQTRLDFLWVIAYVAILAALAALSASWHRRYGLHSMATLGEIMVFVSILAGLLDWIENVLMLTTIRREAGSGLGRNTRLDCFEILLGRLVDECTADAARAHSRIVSMTRWAAIAKFVLVLFAGAYSLVLTPLTLLLWRLICSCGLQT
jgi:hypothetical protein